MKCQVPCLRPGQIGEPLVEALLNQIHSAGNLRGLPCQNSATGTIKTLEELIVAIGIEAPILFYRNVPLQQVVFAEQEYRFDGMSRVDCLVARGSAGLAIEVKLGISRMAPGEFRRRFLRPCAGRSTQRARIKGNMIAVLDGCFSTAGFADLSLTAAPNVGQPLTLVQSWVLLIRHKVAKAWAENPPKFRRDCWILQFEDLVRAVGGQKEFDRVVSVIVGDQFAAAWDVLRK